MYLENIDQMESRLRQDISSTGASGFGFVPLIPLAIGLGGAAIGAGIGYAFGKPAVDAQGQPQTAAGVFADRAGKGIASALTLGAVGLIAYKWFSKK